MGDGSFTVEVRKVDTEYGETGVGVGARTETTYELGTTVGGAWIRFASVPASTVDAAVEREAARPKPAAESSSSSSDDGPTMDEVTPTPAPQQQAAEASAGGAPA